MTVELGNATRASIVSGDHGRRQPDWRGHGGRRAARGRPAAGHLRAARRPRDARPAHRQDRGLRAQEQVKQAEAAQEVSQATIRQREADLQLAQTNVERSRNLFERQLLPKQTLDDNEARYQSAQSRSSISRARRTTSRRRGSTSCASTSPTPIITSPVNGFVVRARGRPGRLRRRRTRRSSTSWTSAASGWSPTSSRRISSSCRPATRRGSRWTRFPARCSRAASRASSPVLDPATRTAPIEIEIPNPDFRLKPGMYARVGITTDTKKDALVVPTNARRRSRRPARRVPAAERARRSSGPCELGTENERRRRSPRRPRRGRSGHHHRRAGAARRRPHPALRRGDGRRGGRGGRSGGGMARRAAARGEARRSPAVRLAVRRQPAAGATAAGAPAARPARPAATAGASGGDGRSTAATGSGDAAQRQAAAVLSGRSRHVHVRHRQSVDMSIPRLAIQRPVTMFMISAVITLLGAHLADPAAGRPDAGVRAADAHRAHQLRRRRPARDGGADHAADGAGGQRRARRRPASSRSRPRATARCSSTSTGAPTCRKPPTKSARASTACADGCPRTPTRRRFFKFDSNPLPIMQIGVEGDYDPVTLREIAQNEIAPRFERVDGVAAVTVNGGLRRQIHVELSKEKITALNLSVNQVVQTLRSENQNTPLGEIYQGDATYPRPQPGPVPEPRGHPQPRRDDARGRAGLPARHRRGQGHHRAAPVVHAHQRQARRPDSGAEAVGQEHRRGRRSASGPRSSASTAKCPASR